MDDLSSPNLLCTLNQSLVRSRPWCYWSWSSYLPILFNFTYLSGLTVFTPQALFISPRSTFPFNPHLTLSTTYDSFDNFRIDRPSHFRNPKGLVLFLHDIPHKILLSEPLPQVSPDLFLIGTTGRKRSQRDVFGSTRFCTRTSSDYNFCKVKKGIGTRGRR